MNSNLKKALVLMFVIMIVGSSLVFGKPATKRISIGTADSAGVYYIYGGGIAKVISAYVPNTTATAEVTPGAVDNIKLMNNDTLDIAFTKLDIAADAVNGRGPFVKEGKMSVRVIAKLYYDVAHAVVSTSSGITSIEEMKGKRISTSQPGSGHELVASKLLEAAGLNWEKDIRRERISLKESGDAFKDGKIDGFFFATGMPAAAMLDICNTQGLSYMLLDLEKYNAAITRKYGKIYDLLTIPKGTYAKMERDVKTVGIPVLLVAQKSTDKELVYNITKALFEHQQELIAVHKEAKSLTLENASSVTVVPYHPGALQYYKEKGVIK
ncbi:MAG: TAXI family TRAP transporter solute-binding subunit [Bacteroidota bacterium]